MATFQLMGIPSLQVANQNAPSAAVAPVQQYAQQPTNGQAAVQGLAGIAQLATGIQQADKQKQFQQAFGQAYASGDRDALKQLAASNPEQLQAIQQGMGLIDAEKNKQIGNAATDLQLAAITGPQAVQAAAQKHSGALQQLGLTPDAAVQAYQQNPQQFTQYADLIGMHALGPEQYYNLRANQQKLQQTGQIAQANLGLKQQQLQQQGDYQNAQTQQGWQRLSIEQQKNAVDAEDKRLNRQIQAGKATADQQKTLQANTQKKQDLVNAYDTQANTVSGMLTTVNQVKQIDPDTFNGIWGAKGVINRNLPGSGSADAWSQIEQMQAQARLMGVVGMKGTGPVSDAEGQAAASAFLAVKPNMSPDAARRAINNWQTVLNRQVRYLENQRPSIDKYRSDISGAVSGQQSSPQIQTGHSEGGYTFMGGDPANQRNWRKN